MLKRRGFAALMLYSHAVTLALSPNREKSQTPGAAPTKNELESLATPGPDSGPDADGECACAQQARVEGDDRCRPRWLKTRFWKRLTRPFQCWMEVAARQEARTERDERLVLLEHSEPGTQEVAAASKDSFEEVDFGSYFQDYLDPGYRTQPEWEDSEKPSFEHFLSQPTTLSDHLAWQLGSLKLEPRLHEAVEYVIGNLDEDGYLTASEEELAAAMSHPAGSVNGNGSGAQATPEALEVMKAAMC